EDFRPLPILVDSTRRKSLIHWQERAAALGTRVRIPFSSALVDGQTIAWGNTPLCQISLGVQMLALSFTNRSERAERRCRTSSELLRHEQVKGETRAVVGCTFAFVRARITCAGSLDTPSIVDHGTPAI